MAAAFEPPPTYADVILFDKEGKHPKFNPIWLKWFVDVAALLTTSGGGGGGIDHNSLSGLQGGSANQYYHLTSTQQSALTAGFTGTGNLVRQTSATLITPALGTPSSGTLTNCTGLPNGGLLNSSMTIAGHSTALGGSVTIAAADLSNGVSGTGAILLASNVGISTTITTAALTGAGTQGSMTFVNGWLTASTPAT